MATPDEIELRIQEADTARSAKRTHAARQVGELAQRRAVLAGQLDDIERQLGDLLADAGDVMDIDELARFTDIPAPDLKRWLTTQQPVRAKRNKHVGGAPSDTRRGPGTAGTPMNDRTATPPPGRRADAVDAPASVTAGPA